MDAVEVKTNVSKPTTPPTGASGMSDHDPVNHPTHYASEAKCSGCNEPIECIDVVRHMSFDQGNAMKYLWRAGKKDATVQDLKKAVWYIQDMISSLEGTKNPNVHRLAGIRAENLKTFEDEAGAWTQVSNESPTLDDDPETEFGCKFTKFEYVNRLTGYKFVCDTHGCEMIMPTLVSPAACTKARRENNGTLSTPAEGG